MTIKYNDDVKFIIIGLGFAVASAIFLFFVEFYRSFDFAGKLFLLAFFVWLVFFYIKGVILVGRTISLNENGCTIRLFGYEKTYSWDAFYVKRLEKYREPIYIFPRSQFSWKGIILYPHKTMKPKKFNPEMYLLFFAIFPFSYIFISLIPTKIESYQGSYANLKFQINEDEFLSKMKEWNVNIEHCK